MKMKKALYSLSAIATATLCLATAVNPAYASSASSEQNAQKQNSKNPFQHVYVIMMENHGNADIIGNPLMPNMNSLINNYGFDDNYYGVTHPSLPNYAALISGSNWNTYDDNSSDRFDVPNLVDQLESKNLTWKGYMESMPSVGYTGTGSGSLYAIRHNPFMLMTDIAGNPARLQNIMPFTQFQQDLNNNTVPNFSFITPNLINDMHGVSGSTDQQLYQAGDKFVQDTVQEIMSSKSWKTSKSVIYITFDEGDDSGEGPAAPGPNAKYPGGGNTPLIMIDNTYLHPFTIHTWADHYSLLRTIEQNWGLSFLANAANPQVTTLPVPGEPKLNQDNNQNNN
ncbi:alkaline phosphatase family protein [Alicyclobacillus dauci]|uniref:Alkaline phosphatase family protein n=1 Tax=Alicyclobacillus dauci TaxID=1475485 RepID=A0ABY6YXR3_9BACL|nr:alkaline phosphatase family protein [Alicyclobacillus dauci]WAH35199.1 alkaline phosphatase family protein [Alicyclobacillus dauci]